jgi:multiple antibiotic resistance protein
VKTLESCGFAPTTLPLPCGGTANLPWSAAGMLALRPDYHPRMGLFKPLVALLAIVNPIAIVPFFIHFTQNLSRAERQRTIRISSFTAFVVIAVSALAGLKVIEFFGISIASFQVGGGTLLLISALAMLNAQPAESKPADVVEGEQKIVSGASIAVVPLTIPLLTGPATISTMVIYAERTQHWWELAALVGYGVVVALVTFVTFSAAGTIARWLGRTGINVMTRLMGLILSALAVEIMADGLVKLFPVLAGQVVR